MDDKSGDRLVWLALWAKNMEAARRPGWDWPGFTYSPTEWQRLRTLAAAVGEASLTFFRVAVAVIFVAITAIAVLAIVWILDLMNIRSAAVPPWVFRATLPFGVLMMLGELMPLSLRLAVRFAIDAETRSRLARLPAAPDDAELAAKVARQFRRVALFASGVVTAMVLSDFLVPPPLGNWMPWVIAIGAGIVAVL